MRAGLFTPPPEIAEFHRALLVALGVDYFPPGMADVNAWREFLFLLDTLKDSAGGPLTARDIHAVVALMRQQNRDRKAGWSLRFGKIMREPEAFRDLVLEARKVKRPRAPIETVTRVDATGAALQVERDPALESEATTAGAAAAAQLREFRNRMKNGGQQG
jgi:hypothetical protein